MQVNLLLAPEYIDEGSTETDVEVRIITFSYSTPSTCIRGSMNDERRDDSRTENDELRLMVLDASTVLQG
jgi:hypothetical protein